MPLWHLSAVYWPLDQNFHQLVNWVTFSTARGESSIDVGT
jgi:hypothetical protein